MSRYGEGEETIKREIKNGNKKKRKKDAAPSYEKYRFCAEAEHYVRRRKKKHKRHIGRDEKSPASLTIT